MRARLGAKQIVFYWKVGASVVDAPTQARSGIVLRIGILLGMVPFAVALALFLRVTILSGGDQDAYRILYFAPFTAVPAFVVQMLGLLLSARSKKPVSIAAGRMVITTMLWVVLAVVIMVRGLV